MMQQCNVSEVESFCLFASEEQFSLLLNLRDINVSIKMRLSGFDYFLQTLFFKSFMYNFLI